jgi:two-component system chemotaxis sensor kinase CheA
LAVLGLALSALVANAIVDATQRAVESNSVQAAEMLVRQLSGLRAYYTKEVVGPARRVGVIPTHRYREESNAIPLPATMIHDLNARTTVGGASVRLFSDAPFPWRADGGVRDSFEREAWAAFVRDSSKAYWRIDADADEPTVRYAVADLMVDQACVDCHNAHPDSPRRDWKLGDVRGALEVSMPIGARLAAARADARRLATMAILAVLAAMAVIVALVHRFVALPIAAIQAASRDVARGQLDRRAVRSTDDELGKLTGTFNDMVDDLQARDAQLAAHRRDLEAAVAHRTAALARRNAEMVEVFDNVQQGFVTLDRHGHMSDERSAILVRWLGPSHAPRFADYIGQHDAAVAVWFDVAWAQLFDEVLPTDVALDQLPKQVAVVGRDLALEYHPIRENDRLHRVLVVVSDITERLAHELAERRQRELLTVFQAMMCDKSGFLEFFREAEALVEAIRTKRDDMVTVRRYVHTLKGNSAIYGILSISELCHDMESRIADAATPPTDQDLGELAERWRALRASLSRLLDEPRGGVEITDHEYESILRAVIERRPRPELEAMIVAWRREPAERALERLAGHARSLAARLGRGELCAVVDGGGVRLDARAWAPFWSAAVHVVRNAVDHGLESVDERLASHKPTSPTLRFLARSELDRFVVEIADDGRGIDWAQVERAAIERGLPHATQRDLEAVLFADGFSTRADVTDLSGRGVGLGAARAACESLGGTVVLRTAPGRGTSVRFVFPWTATNEGSRERGATRVHEPQATAQPRPSLLPA